MPRYAQLRVDGVLGDVYDSEAVHTDDVVNVVLDVLDSPVIRTALLNIYHPIGSYYFTDRDINPSSFLGGSWDKVEGKVLLGASTKYPVNSTGGYEDSIVPEHTHNAQGVTANAGEHWHTGTGTATTAGAHYHGLTGFFSGGSGGHNSRYVNENRRLDLTRYTDSAGAHAHTVSITTGNAGEHSHDVSITVANAGESGIGRNMMPYKAAYIWVRVA